MKVLHVHSGNLYGGVETLLRTLAQCRHLSPAMTPSFALCFDSRIAAELRHSGVPVHQLTEVRLRNPASVIRARTRLRELLQREHFDVSVVHSFWTHTVFGRVLRQVGIPVAFYLHGKASGRHWLERWARRSAPDLVLCNSKFTEGSAKLLFPKTPRCIAYPPLEMPQPADIHCKHSARAGFDVPRDTIVVVHVGRMEEGKGQDLLIGAARRLDGRIPIEIWLIGGADSPAEKRWQRRLTARAQSMPAGVAVRFLGHRTDVVDVLRAADLLCHPTSRPEGFGLVLIEALAVGLPVVATNHGGAAEIVDPSCGLLVPTTDLASLTAALSYLIENKSRRMKMITSGPARALSLCDPKQRMGELSAHLRGMSEPGISGERANTWRR